MRERAKDIARSFDVCAAAVREWADALTTIEAERDETTRRLAIEGVSDAAAAWLGDALERVSRSLCGRDVVFRSEPGAPHAATWDGALALFALGRLADATIAAGRGISRVDLFLLVADAERRHGCTGTQSFPVRAPARGSRVEQSTRTGDESCGHALRAASVAGSRRWLS